MMKIISINIRGLGISVKRPYLKDITWKEHIGMI